MKYFNKGVFNKNVVQIVGTRIGLLFLLALACHAAAVVVVAASDVNWSTLNADQLSQLPNSAFNSMSSSDLSSIPPTACSGFQYSQVSSVNDYACSGFKSACFSNMLSSAFTGFTSSCFRNIPNQELSGINSAEKFGKLSTNVIASLSSSAIAALNVNACAGFSYNQVAAINNDYPTFACSGFTSQCFNAIPLESLSDLTSSCVGNLDASMVNQISGSSIANFPAASFSGWTQNQVVKLTSFDICSNFSQNQIGAMNNDYPVFVCSALQASCLSAMQPSAYAGMTSACVNQLDVSQINGISQPEQISNIPASSFAGFSSNQIAKFPPKTCSGLNSDQATTLDNSYPKYACQGFKSECLSNIPANAFTGFSSSCVSQVDAVQMSGLLASQLAQIPNSAYSGFTSNQISYFNPSSCSGISSSQLSNLNNGYPNYACQGFKSECLSNIPERSYNGFTSTCINNLMASQVNRISASQMKQITPNAFGGFTSQQVSNWNPSSCTGITSSQVSSLNNGYPNYACQGLTATCLSNISDSSYSGFNSVCLSNIPPQSMKGIDASQLTNIPYNQINGLVQDQVAMLNNSTCSGFTSFQINRLSNSGCSGFQYGCLSELTPLNIVSSLTSQCFSNIPSSSVSGFKVETIPYFTSDTLSGLQLNQLVAWFNSYGEKYFVSVATQKQLSTVNSGVVLQFKEKIEKSEIQRYRTLESNQLSSTTWLQLSLSTDDSLKNVLNAHTMTDITFAQTFYGLLNNVNKLPRDVFSKLQVSSFYYFLSDTVGGFTAEQISYIIPSAFENPNGISRNVAYINPNSVKGITYQQLDVLLKYDYLGRIFTCKQFMAMTQYQVDYIRNTNSYKQLVGKCGTPNPPPQPSGSLLPPPPPPHPPSPSPLTSNSVQPVQSKKPQPRRSLGMSDIKHGASYFVVIIMSVFVLMLQ